MTTLQKALVSAGLVERLDPIQSKEYREGYYAAESDSAKNPYAEGTWQWAEFEEGFAAGHFDACDCGFID